MFFYQRTPLHIAAEEGFKHTVDSLVKKGANIKIKDKEGVSATGILKVDLMWWDLSVISWHNLF